MKITVIVFLVMIISCVVQAQYLNPGDGVRIAFFNISDQISGDYYIQQDGHIQLPYVGLIANGEQILSCNQSEISRKI